MKLKCIYCGKPLTGDQRKFCCPNHSNKWRYYNNSHAQERMKKQSKESYERRKNTEEFKKQKKYNYRKRIQNSKYKKKLFAEIKENAKRWQKKKKIEWKAKRLCSKCGRIIDEKRWVQCSKCREKGRLWYKK